MKARDDGSAAAAAAAAVPETDQAALLALAGVLEQLARSAAEAPGKRCSLAKLSKRTQRPMSVLQRQLTVLQEAGLVLVVNDDAGRTSASLSEAGLQMCRQLSGA